MDSAEEIKEKIDGFLKKQGVELKDGFFILRSLMNDYGDEIENEPDEEDTEDESFDEFESESSDSDSGELPPAVDEEDGDEPVDLFEEAEKEKLSEPEEGEITAETPLPKKPVKDHGKPVRPRLNTPVKRPKVRVAK